MRETDETLTRILRAADRHPNSRIAKLIRCFEEERTQKNIVMLLIELADSSEYCLDFDISLIYYLKQFERLGVGRDIVLNEAGLLLLNSSKIYSRRVDYVQELVHRQILSLTSADHELAATRNEEADKDSAKKDAEAEKPRRPRKRLVESTTDPYEVQLEAKKIRTISNEKRFALNASVSASASASAAASPNAKAKSVQQRQLETEQYIHPAQWVHSCIKDFDNDDEVDSKRNYKLFTYHKEHRYNTLVPDINFRLYFKVKDYIDAEEERMDVDEAAVNLWPPLSEQYIQKYLDLENRIFKQEMQRNNPNGALDMTDDYEGSDQDDGNVEDANDTVDGVESGVNAATFGTVDAAGTAGASKETEGESDQTSNNDSGLGCSLLDSTNANSSITTANDSVASRQGDDASTVDGQTNLNSSDASAPSGTADLAAEEQHSLNTTTLPANESISDETLPQNDSGLGVSVSELDDTQNASTTLDTTGSDCDQPDQEITKLLAGTFGVDVARMKNDRRAAEKIVDGCINLEEIRVHLPHLDDEGVYFSELDERQQRMLSPTVVATDLFPSIPNKKNLTIIVDDEIRALLNLPTEEPESYILPTEKEIAPTPIVYNILKIDEKVLRRRVLFKLGEEMDLYIKARCMKRTRCVEVRQPRQFKLRRFSNEDDRLRNGKLLQDGYESDFDFHGFPEAGLMIDYYSDPEEFYGFTEDEQDDSIEDRLHRLSSDSGVEGDLVMRSMADNSETNPPAVNTSALLDEACRPVADSMLDGDAGNANISEELTNAVEPVDEEEFNTENLGDFLECVVEVIEIDDDDEANDVDRNTAQNLTEEEIAQQVASIKEEEADEAEKEQNAPTIEASPTLNNSNEVTNSFNSAEMHDAAEETSTFHFADANDEMEDAAEDIDFQSTKTKIQRWHEHLQPILAKSRERHHFDVFQIGTEIMDEFGTRADDLLADESASAPQRGESITFENVMANKDETYVSRYFLSSLLLANQNNITINVKNKSTEAPSEWGDIQFELISTKRHTVAIEDNIGMINATTEVVQAPNSSSSIINRSISAPSGHPQRPKASKDPPLPTTTRTTATPAMSTPTATPDAATEVAAPEAASEDDPHGPLRPPKSIRTARVQCTSSPYSRVANLSDLVNVNLSVIKPLRKIEQQPQYGDDHDSGIFSSEELLL